MKKSIPGTSVLARQGFEAKIIEVLSRVMNFKYDIVDCGREWGKKLANGSWDGMVGAVYDKVTKCF